MRPKTALQVHRRCLPHRPSWRLWSFNGIGQAAYLSLLHLLSLSSSSTSCITYPCPGCDGPWTLENKAASPQPTETHSTRKSFGPLYLLTFTKALAAGPRDAPGRVPDATYRAYLIQRFYVLFTMRSEQPDVFKSPTPLMTAPVLQLVPNRQPKRKPLDLRHQGSSLYVVITSPIHPLSTFFRALRLYSIYFDEVVSATSLPSTSPSEVWKTADTSWLANSFLESPDHVILHHHHLTTGVWLRTGWSYWTSWIASRPNWTWYLVLLDLVKDYWTPMDWLLPPKWLPAHIRYRIWTQRQ
jgi:hypothetical protein